MQKLFLFLLLMALERESHGSSIRIYNSMHFNGTYDQQEVFEHCKVFEHKSLQNESVISIKTSSCTLVYEKTNCIGRYVQIIKSRPSPHITSRLNLEIKVDPDSKTKTTYLYYRSCRHGEFGETIDVDIFQEKDYQTLTAKYKDVCDCTALPNEIHGRVGSIDNHGNCLLMYYSKDCSGQGTWVNGGKNMATENLHNRLMRDGNSNMSNGF